MSIVNKYQTQLDVLSKKLEQLKSTDTTFLNSNHFEKIKTNLEDSLNSGQIMLKENDTLKIGIVGQVKAGKSSFLNSLFFNGESVLPKASTPMTAGLTIIEYGETPEFVVEYYSKLDWGIIEKKYKEYIQIEEDIINEEPDIKEDKIGLQKELEQRCGEDVYSAAELFILAAKNRNALTKIEETSRKETHPFSTDNLKNLQTDFKKYVGADGEYTPVTKSITIRLNREDLKGVQVVDTPGVNDPIISRENKTKEYLRECHGVFLLSYSGQFCSKTDMDFLNNRISAEGIGAIVVLASKFDSVLVDEGQKYEGNLQSCAKALTYKLSEGLKKALENSEVKNKQIQFDISSGICFSIVQKLQEGKELDSVEDTVLSNLEELFPEVINRELPHFNNLLLGLANFKRIREEYLKNKFIASKENIISTKIDTYFKNLSENLNTSLAKEIKRVRLELESIDKYSTDTLAEIDKKNEELYEDLSNKFSKSCDLNKKTLTKNIWDFNERETQWTFKKEHTRKDTFNIIVDGFLFDDNESVRVDVFDSSATALYLKNHLEDYKKNIYNSWKIKFGEKGSFILQVKNSLIDTLKIQIDKDAIKKGEVAFSMDEWLEIIDDVFADLNNESSLYISNIIQETENSIENKINSGKLDFNPSTPRCKSDKLEDTKRNLISQSKSKTASANVAINALTKDLSNKVCTKTNAVKDKLVNIIDTLKKDFKSEIQKASNEYVAELQKKIDNKEESKPQLQSYLKVLEDVQKAL